MSMDIYITKVYIYPWLYVSNDQYLFTTYINITKVRHGKVYVNGYTNLRRSF